MYVPVPAFSVSWEPSRLHLVPSPSVFACYSNLELNSSEADNGHTWRISTTHFLIFLAVLFIAADHDCVSMSKTTDLKIVTDGLGELVPMLDLLPCWIDVLSFFAIFCKTGFMLVVA